MRPLVGWLGLAIGFCACSSEEGALLVLSNPSNAAIVRVEVVLASTDEVVPVKQRITTQSTLEEDVRYYKQASTTRAIELGKKAADKLTILVAPGPGKAQSFIPFVFGYAADNSLVAIGRVQQGDVDQTPISITIPTGELDRFDVELEPMDVPDPAVGIARNTGTAVTCVTDSVVRGAAWKFAKGIQLRMVFAKPGEISGLANPYDLDCDDHDIATQHDCDDLEIGFNPGADETCGQPDFNCDGVYAGTVTCAAFPNCPGHTGCGPNADVCSPDPAALNTDACFCPANDCRTGATCQIAQKAGAVCAPAYVVVSDICNNGNQAPCTVTVLDPVPANWAVEVAHLDLMGGLQFGPMAVMPSGSPSMALRMTSIATPQSTIGTVVLEVRSPTSTPTRHFIDVSFDPAAHTECPTIVVPDVSGAMVLVDSMSCSNF